MTSTATEDGDDFLINGRKIFTSLAPDADIYTVYAKTDPEKGTRGISAFVVEKEFAGFEPGERMDLMSAHPIGGPSFNNCRVPKSNLIGQINTGFKISMKNLDFFRSTVGAASVGMAQAALDEAVAYAKKRIQFGKPISEFQAIQFKTGGYGHAAHRGAGSGLSGRIHQGWRRRPNHHGIFNGQTVRHGSGLANHR